MLDIITYGDFKPLGKQKKKHQIILTNTSRSIEDYLSALKNRFNGSYHRIPNYIVTREGKILKLLSNIEHSNYFININQNRNSIVVCLENLGWLQKEPLNDRYVNWIGDIYKGNVFERKWRDYYFWHPYTTTQIENTGELCKEIIKDMSIPKQSVEHNTKIIGIDKYDGIVTRSNFNEKYTDVNPSFNFELFLKTIYDE
jgi:N-acetyl-anhydromuramyl-L-alanine amidase AmpD